MLQIILFFGARLHGLHSSSVPEGNIYITVAKYRELLRSNKVLDLTCYHMRKSQSSVSFPHFLVLNARML